MANNVAVSPPGAGRIPNTEAQVQQDGVAALHRVLCAESFAEKDRQLSEMILQLQLIRERLLQQQDQSKVNKFSPRACGAFAYRKGITRVEGKSGIIIYDYTDSRYGIIPRTKKTLNSESDAATNSNRTILDIVYQFKIEEKRCAHRKRCS